MVLNFSGNVFRCVFFNFNFLRASYINSESTSLLPLQLFSSFQNHDFFWNYYMCVYVYICTYISVYIPSSNYLMFPFYAYADWLCDIGKSYAFRSLRTWHITLSIYRYINISLHQSAKLLKNSTFSFLFSSDIGPIIILKHFISLD